MDLDLGLIHKVLHNHLGYGVDHGQTSRTPGSRNPMGRFYRLPQRKATEPYVCRVNPNSNPVAPTCLFLEVFRVSKPQFPYLFRMFCKVMWIWMGWYIDP